VNRLLIRGHYDTFASDLTKVPSTVTMYNLTRLAEALQQWPRSKAWKLMLQDPNLPPDVRSLLQQHIDISQRWERAQEAPERSDVPRYIQIGKKTRQRGSQGLCKVCDEPLPHDTSSKNHMFRMQQRFWGRRWWAKRSPAERSHRTAAARRNRWTKHWDERLKNEVNPRILKLIGRDKAIWQLKQASKH
jgi:hypothetical protein